MSQQTRQTSRAGFHKRQQYHWEFIVKSACLVFKTDKLSTSHYCITSYLYSVTSIFLIKIKTDSA
jgi:hypothetical protein